MAKSNRKTTPVSPPLTGTALYTQLYTDYRRSYGRDAYVKPDITFSVGETVELGKLPSPVIVDIHPDGLLAIVFYIHTTRDGSSETYNCFAVHEMNKLSHRSTTFHLAAKPLSRIHYMNKDVRSLLHYALYCGVDDSPEYQRKYCWDAADRTALLDSVFANYDIGKFLLCAKPSSADDSYEIVDGKQRLTTLLDFYLNRFAYRGFYWNDLSPEDRRAFEGKNIAMALFENPLSLADKMELFLAVNTTGKPQDTKHLDAVAKRLTQLKAEL